VRPDKSRCKCEPATGEVGDFQKETCGDRGPIEDFITFGSPPERDDSFGSRHRALAEVQADITEAQLDNLFLRIDSIEAEHVPVQEVGHVAGKAVIATG